MDVDLMVVSHLLELKSVVTETVTVVNPEFGSVQCATSLRVVETVILDYLYFI